MAATVADVLGLVNGIAPFELSEAWDNTGLLAGDPAQTVTRVLCALDLNEAVLGEAQALGAELIVTHHPILFRGRKNLAALDPEGRLLAGLVRAGVAMIAAHTNYDAAEYGVNAALAERLGIRNAVSLESGMRIGDIDEMPLEALAAHVTDRLGGVVRRYGEKTRHVSRVAILGGSGGSYAQIARDAGADVFITGETGYHDALDSLAWGMCTLEAGHAATELPAVGALARGLQIAADAVQYNIEILESAIEPFL